MTNQRAAWGTDTGAPDGRSIYRYTLWRNWLPIGERGEAFVMFIGLNPSTATDTEDDPTIRRCVDFAKRWGFGALLMTNLFAFRATDPEDMKAHPMPIGPENDKWLAHFAERAGMVICAWGNHGTHLARASAVLAILARARADRHRLKATGAGHPGHPLYIPAKTTPETF